MVEIKQLYLIGPGAWIIHFEYSESGMNISGKILHETKTPLIYHPEVAKGVVLARLSMVI